MTSRSILRSLVFWSVVSAGSVQAIPVLRFDPLPERADLSSFAEYRLVSSDTLSVFDVSGAAADWKAVGEENLNLGYTTDTCWIRWSVLAEVDEDVVLEVGSPLLDEVDLYMLRDGALIYAERTGDARPYADRPYDIHVFAFPVRIEGDAPCEFLLRVKTTSSLQVPLTLWTPQAFAEAGMGLYGFYGIIYGVMGVIVLYNLILWFSIRERNNLYFVIYTTSFLGLMTAIQGLGYRYLWPANPWMQQQGVAVMICLTSGLALLFAGNFLTRCAVSSRCARIYRGLTVVCGLMAVAAVVAPYTAIIRPCMALTVLVILLNLVLSVRVWRGGSRPAGWFAAAMAAFLAGVLTLIASKIGLLPRTLITENAPTLGMVAQASLLTLALMKRIQDDKQSRHEAQLDLVESQKENNRKLQRAVQQQTSELQSMMRQLAQANEDLDMNNRLDGLTGIFNRRAFDERLALEFAHAQRGGGRITVVMLDIDKFKNFNDTYGHLVGDDCLRAVAQALNETAQRTTDFAARYGGEEFAVIIPDTRPDQATAFGELVRRAIEQMVFEVDGSRVPVTVSVGVGTLVPAKEEAPEAVISIADAAMYRAKANGRNRVESDARVGEPTVS